MNAEEKARDPFKEKAMMIMGYFAGHAYSNAAFVVTVDSIKEALTDAYREGQESVLARLPSDDEVNKKLGPRGFVYPLAFKDGVNFVTQRVRGEK